MGVKENQKRKREGAEVCEREEYGRLRQMLKGGQAMRQIGREREREMDR